jgi:hypothetical protein
MVNVQVKLVCHLGNLRFQQIQTRMIKGDGCHKSAPQIPDFFVMWINV